MTRKRRWLWILLFIFGAILWITLATGWNVVIVRDYKRMLELAKSVSAPNDAVGMGPWPFVVTGWLGFAAALTTMILFFIKILREMKLNQLQAEFLATVSHELKTPIASIELSASLLKSGGLTPEETEKLWNSHHLELKRLRSEVEAILEALRWQANPWSAKLATADLEAWLQSSLERWQSLLGSQASLRREGDELPRHVQMDLRSLNLILDNLIDNARKFSRGAPKVTIRTTRTPGSKVFSKSTWKIEVRDEGLGFDPEESKKLFKRFFRAQHAAPYSIPGTGLGLYLAISASRSLKIKLSGESLGHGQGATFTLEGQDSAPASEQK